MLKRRSELLIAIKIDCRVYNKKKRPEWVFLSGLLFFFVVFVNGVNHYLDAVGKLLRGFRIVTTMNLTDSDARF